MLDTDHSCTQQSPCRAKKRERRPAVPPSPTLCRASTQFTCTREYVDTRLPGILARALPCWRRCWSSVMEGAGGIRGLGWYGAMRCWMSDGLTAWRIGDDVMLLEAHHWMISGRFSQDVAANILSVPVQVDNPNQSDPTNVPSTLPTPPSVIPTTTKRKRKLVL